MARLGPPHLRSDAGRRLRQPLYRAARGGVRRRRDQPAGRLPIHRPAPPLCRRGHHLGIDDSRAWPRAHGPDPRRPDRRALRRRAGSMRVTEQIDALESLGRSPVTHLLLPRILAGLIAIPALVMLANAFGIVVGYITARSSLGLTYADFEFGSRYFFRPLDLWYSLIKSYAFAGAVTIIPCYIGFNTQQGAEGVGRATTQAVVASSVTVLMLDTILTKIILGTAK